MINDDLHEVNAPRQREASVGSKATSLLQVASETWRTDELRRFNPFKPDPSLMNPLLEDDE